MIALAGMCLFPGLSQAADEGDLSKYLNKQSFDSISELLAKGDIAYKRDDMKTAVQEYSSARKESSSKILPPRFKQAVDERYAQALAQLAHQEARAGRQDSAEKLIEEAYTLAPQAPGVKKVKLQLADTIRFNPAASDENAKNVTEVNELLQKAFGSYDLGDYDKADQYFESVLKIDAYNTAARRGMEKVEQGRQNYYNAAYDQTRSEMLNQVSGGWAQTVPLELGDIPDYSKSGADNTVQTGVAGKLNSLVIDNVNLEDVNLLEAIEFVRRQARRVDTAASEADRGVNIIADVGTANDPAAKAAFGRRFNIKLRNAPLSEVLRYIADMTGTQVRVTPYATKLVLGNENAGEILMRTFKVSPDFFSSGGNVQSQESSDPFSGGGSTSSGLRIRHANPVEFFKNSGIQFPAGASAQYSAGSSSLTVRNTPSNLNLIEDLIAAKQSEKPAQVIIKATMMEVSRRELHELGFDWVIAPMRIGEHSKRLIGGGTQGNGGDVYSNMNRRAGENPAPDSGVVTAGLRSGDEAFPDNSLDSIIAAGIGRMDQQEYKRRAPGIISARAVFSNGDIAVVMRGLNQNKNIDTLQQPQIIARSGEKASFSHVREFIYPTDYTEPQLPSSIGTESRRRRSSVIIDGELTNVGGGTSTPTTFPVTPSHPTGFATKPVGVTLEVEPTISEDRTMVELQLVPTMVDFDGFVNFGSPIKTSMLTSDNETGIASVTLSQNAILMPVFSRKSMETKVTIANGYTVVLGGLIKSKKEKFEDKVPVLGDIPYFGRLFRSEGEKTEEKVLIIMVRADVVDPSGQNVRSLTPDDPS